MQLKYISKTRFLLYIFKTLVITFFIKISFDNILGQRLCQFGQFEISPSWSQFVGAVLTHGNTFFVCSVWHVFFNMRIMFFGIKETRKFNVFNKILLLLSP
jgi:hypothetical protein